jgi:hypothetical protein
MAIPVDQPGDDVESYTAIKAQIDQMAAMFANLKTHRDAYNETLQTLQPMVDKAPELYEAIARISNPALRDTLRGMLADLIAM